MAFDKTREQPACAGKKRRFDEFVEEMQFLNETIELGYYYAGHNPVQGIQGIVARLRK